MQLQSDSRVTSSRARESASHQEAIDESGPRQKRVEHWLYKRAGGTSPAIVSGETVCSYGELHDRSTSFAAYLREKGLRESDRVGVFLDKTLDCVVAFFGTWMAGGIVVPINEHLRRNQVQHILADAQCRYLVSTPRKTRSFSRPQFCGAGLLEVAAGHDVLQQPDLVEGTEPAAILYTSGSSGKPKGILVSHGNLVAGARIVSGYLGIRQDDRILSVPPFSFDYGLNQLLVAVRCGACCVLQRSILPADVCRSLQQHRISVMAGVPPFWIQLMQDYSPLAGTELPDLRMLTSTGGTFPRYLVERYREKFPEAEIFLMYGLTEAFRSTFLPPGEIDRRPGSIGKAIPETELFVVDEQGNECGVDEVGELVHVGPTVTLGYWNDTPATEKVFKPHPFDPASSQRAVYSGDLVRRDSEGFLYFVSRHDQMIKSMGYRISPDDLEEQLVRSGMISEAVVTGRRDEAAGEIIIAHVVPLQAATFNLADFVVYCKKELPGYMVPRHVEVHAHFPRTASGKLDRVAVVK